MLDACELNRKEDLFVGIIQISFVYCITTTHRLLITGNFCSAPTYLQHSRTIVPNNSPNQVNLLCFIGDVFIKAVSLFKSWFQKFNLYWCFVFNCDYGSANSSENCFPSNNQYILLHFSLISLSTGLINNLPVLLQYSYRADMFTGSSIFCPFALYIETVANNVFIVDVSSKHQIHPWNLFHLKINKFTKRLI